VHYHENQKGAAGALQSGLALLCVALLLIAH
jgi:hypothetical protein